MSSSDFSQAVIDLIRRCAPNFPAVELLVYLHLHADKSWTTEGLREAMKERGFTLASIAENVTRFQRCGLVEPEPEERFRYRPSEKWADPVKLLVAAFQERPVSLIRVVYATADDHIQTFADSFRLNPE